MSLKNSIPNIEPDIEYRYIVDQYNKTFAELPATVKNAISHRAKAINLLKDYIGK